MYACFKFKQEDHFSVVKIKDVIFFIILLLGEQKNKYYIVFRTTKRVNAYHIHIIISLNTLVE